ncbi:type III secretion system chaperone [Pseudothauera rhizosphaerae]|uniref:type III secretion system chaperone n=1 Tax=Pseudothauera rhizosphaerae TaxID=2565932 RepID=UPI001454DC2C|nr:type III secretion system chaperone [Pseudothauera rhizosphaerae]
MSLRERCARLLEALGRRFGIEGLAFDERGLCALAFDRRMTVYLAADTRLGGMVLFATLGEFEPAERPDLLLAMLRGNFMWRVTEGATLAVDPEKDVALLVQCLSPQGLEADQLEARLEGFVNAALSWAERLQRPPAGAPERAGLAGMMLRV